MRVKRVIAFYFVILAMFTGLVARLLYLAWPGNAYAKAAASHGYYTLKVNGGRGMIYDGSMRPIVNRKTEYTAFVLPSAAAGKLLEPYVEDKQALNKKIASGKPFMVKVDTPNINAPGVTIVQSKVRYSGVSVAPHIVGYLDSDGNGVSGIEKAYDKILRQDSYTISESYAVDAKKRVLDGVAPEFGQSGSGEGGVQLTIDSNVQISTQQAVQKYLTAGAAVVMDVNTGDILAAASGPSFSPDQVAVSLKQAGSPLMNRVFSAYDLGSIFKVAVTATALESGISPDFTMTCIGSIDVSGRTIHCEKRSGHGVENMSLGFENSCNPYYITLGQKVGGEKILDMAERLGFGSGMSLAPGIVSPDGNLPDKQTLLQPVAVANFSIGQGDLMATPIQVARMICAASNGGLMPTPRLVKGLIDNNGKVSERFPDAQPDRVFSPQIAETIKEFMIKTVDEGTGIPAKPMYGGAGGKTSTAQTGWVQGGKTIDEAWFAGFYPAQNPKYAIVAICENGSAGGADAGPVFKYIANSLAPSCGYPTVQQ